MNESSRIDRGSTAVEEIEHTADWAIRVRGKNLEALFQNAAQGMLQLMQASSRSGTPRSKTIELRALDNETLMVTWLEELLFNMETHEVNYTDIDVQKVEGCRLRAIVRETPLAALKKEIKAVTFHDLKIESTDEGFITTIVFDV
ncbi:MAG: archease [Anaerolineales bacterium]|jgi:SHS2 domain-containing protein